MGHHNFDPFAEMAMQHAMQPLIDQLNKEQSSKREAELTKSLELKAQETAGACEELETAGNELLEAMQELGEQTKLIPDEIKERMRIDRAKAEAEQS